MAIAQTERKRPRHTFTMDDEVFELLTRLSEEADVSRSRLLEQMVGRDHEAYERLTNMANQARADRRQFLERLIVRAELPATATAVASALVEAMGQGSRAGTAGHRGGPAQHRLISSVELLWSGLSLQGSWLAQLRLITFRL